MSWKSKTLREGNYTGYLNGKWHQFQGYESCLEELANCIQDTLDYAERQEKINEELKAENWKDKELQAMKADLEKMKDAYYRGFKITEEQDKKIREWQDQHYTNKHRAPGNLSRVKIGGAIGGMFEYRFIPTSIGTSGTCICGSCRRKMMRELGREEDYKTYDQYLDAKEKLVKKYDCEIEFQEIG